MRKLRRRRLWMVPYAYEVEVTVSYPIRWYIQGVFSIKIEGCKISNLYKLSII